MNERIKTDDRYSISKKYLSLPLQTSYLPHERVEGVVDEVPQRRRRLEEWAS